VVAVEFSYLSPLGFGEYGDVVTVFAPINSRLAELERDTLVSKALHDRTS
jgi:hypothetical protein